MSDMQFFGPQAATIADAWNRRGFADRCALLDAALSELPLACDHDEQSRLLPLLLDRARHLDSVQTLPGPTGESNELYLTGRGNTLVFGTAGATAVALAGQIFAALACGNPVLISGHSELQWSNRLVTLLHRIGIPQGVLAITETYPLDRLLRQAPLALVAPVCQPAEALHHQRLLAERDGVLVQLAPETDPAGCCHLLQPEHLYRFVTEKTRTINTTAVGGNATLLELGSHSL